MSKSTRASSLEFPYLGETSLRHRVLLTIMSSTSYALSPISSAKSSNRDHEFWHAAGPARKARQSSGEPSFFHIRDPVHSYQALNSSRLLGHPATKAITNIMISDEGALAFYRILAKGRLSPSNLKSVILHKGDWATCYDHDSRLTSERLSGFIHQMAES
jgi:hypothetical protein